MIRIAQPQLGEEEHALLAQALASGQLTAGPRVARFEEAFAGFVGAPHGIGTSSGTSGLHVALLAAGIGPGDRVLTTPFSFVASSNAILYCGAEPVFADLDPATLNLDPCQAEWLLASEPGIKAMLVVHLYGQPADLDYLTFLARRHQLILIEDCAQAHGARFGARHVGTFGQAGVFSFYPTKNMTTGEGGAVVTADATLAGRVRYLINHGASQRYLHQLLGYNYRLTDLAAAIGLAQLEKLPQFIASRRANAARLTAGLGGLPGLALPGETPGISHAWHQYVVRTARRDALSNHLRLRGIETAVHYPRPIHRQPLYQQLGYSSLHLPQAEEAACQVLSLPVHPGLSPADLEMIVSAVREFFASIGPAV
ncbi:MAG: DegT/DnrJ/EryC1/StrS family aminotransferase [Bacillota bacterium]